MTFLDFIQTYPFTIWSYVALVAASLGLCGYWVVSTEDFGVREGAVWYAILKVLALIPAALIFAIEWLAHRF